VVVASLRELLGYAGLEPPYVLVGHSLGGLYAQLFARLHPADTEGVLLLEAAHPDDHAVMRQHETHFGKALSKLLAMPQALFKQNLHAELAWVEDTVRQVAGAGPFPPVPLTVITGGKTPPGFLMSPAAVGARRAHQQALARLSPLGRHVVAQGSGHFPQITEPALVVRELGALASAAELHAQSQ
jgi:pimeloyl-ACP methyl ester carboxylesterase